MQQFSAESAIFSTALTLSNAKIAGTLLGGAFVDIADNAGTMTINRLRTFDFVIHGDAKSIKTQDFLTSEPGPDRVGSLHIDGDGYVIGINDKFRITNDDLYIMG